MENSNLTREDILRWFKSQKSPKLSDTSLQDAIEDGFGDWESSARGFGISYIVLGSLAIILNSTFLYTLMARKRTTFAHTFYIMILNFTLIDTLKGICSILFALKLLKSDMGTTDSLWTIRVDQYSGLLLRFSNLATILNLLMITLNEYIFICHPLRYSSLVTKGRVVLFVIVTWIISSTFTLANMVAGTMSKSIMIDQECTINANSTSSCVININSSTSSHFAYHVGLIVFCAVCFAITACSYFILLRVISSLVQADMKQNAEFEHLKTGEETKERHVIRRHKYVVVIGSVIVVYSAYLMTYAVIQIIHLVNMSQNFATNRQNSTVYVKYVCYLYISLHSLLQPLCYLRMREFRALLKRTLFCGRFLRRESVITENCYVTSARNNSKHTSV
ncbi:unnamed protein product [Auanema sp. JU1783]|nr:unnamed protein product [Auanema sp. JU1783]